MKRGASCFALALLAACGKPDPAEQARRDAADIAVVEAAQRMVPPLELLTPQPITARDLQRAGLVGTCTFPGDAASAPLLVVTGDRAVLKLRGGLVPYAFDAGSARRADGVWIKYDGKAHTLAFEPEGEGVRLMVRDAWNRVVFRAAGQLNCQTSP